MEFIGYTYDKPSRTINGRWDTVELQYPDDKLFNEASGKIIKGMKEGEDRFIMANEENERYFIDVFDVRYNVLNSTIKIWPHNCKKVK